MPNGVGSFAQQYVPGAGAAMNTYSQAQHKISQVSQSFNTATSGQFGRRDGPDGFQEPQSGYMPRELSVPVRLQKLPTPGQLRLRVRCSCRSGRSTPAGCPWRGAKLQRVQSIAHLVGLSWSAAADVRRWTSSSFSPPTRSPPVRASSRSVLRQRSRLRRTSRLRTPAWTSSAAAVLRRPARRTAAAPVRSTTVRSTARLQPSSRSSAGRLSRQQRWRRILRQRRRLPG
jgi:hypothetical protein